MKLGVFLTNSVLVANATYTQPKNDRFRDDPIQSIKGQAYSDQAGTLYLEESDDAGVNWSATVTVAVSAATTAELPWTKLTKRWFRVRYLNGAVTQTVFGLTQDYMDQSGVRVAFALGETTDAEATADGSVIAVLKRLRTILTDVWVSASHWLKVEIATKIPAGDQVIGKVGIDQATDGTTNKVHAHSPTADDCLVNANLQVNDTDVSTSNPVPVAGTAAHDAAASGNPVQIGGVYRVTDPALTDGDAGAFRLNQKSEAMVELTGSRVSGTLHRSTITSTDKITDFVDASVTIADNGAGTGSLAASTTFYATAIPGNKYGPCKVNTTIDSLASAAYGGSTGSYRMTIAQATDAEWYEIFLSTDAAPKWVGRVTETQRATGGYEITAVGTVAAGGGNPAGTVDINLVGTGIQTSNAVFAQSNSWRPDTITGITCTGKVKAYVHVAVTVTDLRSAPTINVTPFFKTSEVGTTVWYQGQLQPVLLVGGIGQAMYQVFEIDVNAFASMVILLSSFAGQGTSVNVWVELF